MVVVYVCVSGEGGGGLRENETELWTGQQNRAKRVQ